MKRAMIPLVIFMMSSCSKEVEVCITGDMNPDTPGEYTYTWCGENAENIEWKFNGSTYAGQSVTLDLNHKQQYYLEVKGKGKRKEATESFAINVGTKELRVEPTYCSGNYVSDGTQPRAYLYANRSSFQTDYRNNTRANCLDSMDLAKTTYYSGTNANSVSYWNVGFFDVATGDYCVFVEEKLSTGYTNNLSFILTQGNTNVTVTASSMDDVAQVMINSANTQADYNFQKKLFSKTYLLTSVTVNSVNVGVSACNADDSMIFNIDGTWTHNVGSDDCSGAQSNSAGSIYYGDYCTPFSNIQFNGSTTSGTFATSFTVSYLSESVIKVIAFVGGNTIEQEYTAQ